MTKLTIVDKSRLPATIEKLHEFILIGKERLNAHKAKIRAINKLQLAQSAKDDALSDGQDMAEIILDAESKLGEMLKERPEQVRILKSPGGTSIPLPEGITKRESHYAQTVASNPEIVKKIIQQAREEGTLPTTKEVIREVQREKQIQRNSNLSSIPFPKDKYRTVVIDPPWEMKKLEREVRPNQVEFDYPTMTVAEIKDLPIKELCIESGSHIYLWTTQKYLPISFQIFEHWGIAYIFTMVWHKSGGFQPFNLAQYNCEFVLFGRIGNLDFSTTKDFPCCFEGERQGHSIKPDRFYEIVQRVSAEPRLEMFTRKQREGFTVWGNEC